MKQSFLNEQQLPLVIEPNGNGKTKEDLVRWLQASKDTFIQQYYKHGAILFRGFDLETPGDFESIAWEVDPRLRNDYYGTSPRNIVKGTTYIYTASELPAHYPIPQHCEMSYVTHPPISLFFYCHVEPEYGGETPICDFRKVYAGLNKEVREAFDKKGVLTVRNYSGLENKSRFNLFELKKWNEIFHTTDKAEVERQCKEQQIEFEWLPGGNLRLMHRTPASIEHPVLKDKVWVNHLQVFHPESAKFEYQHIHSRQQRGKTFFWKNFISAMVKFKSIGTKPIDQSMNALFGDGNAIPASYVEHVQEQIWNNMVIFPWKKNDIIAIDNFSTSHGRLPYEGKREILVCWSA